MNKTLERVIERLNDLGAISDDDTFLSRFYGTAAHKKAGNLLMSWMKEIGLEVYRDAIGNIRGVLQSKSTNAKHFVVGSHYDTVSNAGKYDGPLGIIMGLEMAKRIVDMDIELPFHLNIVAFADEEGSRFNTAYLGSSVIAGNFDKTWLDRRDENGIALSKVITKNGGSLTKLFEDAIPQKDWLGYFEPHIEQGPVLCNEKKPVCLVSGIAAQARINVVWNGVNGHAGTSPMELRNDALCAAAEFILAVESVGKVNKDKMVATVGKLHVAPNTSNVVPGEICHSIDVRTMDDGFLDKITHELKIKAKEISAKRQILLQWSVMQTNPSVACDSQLKNILSNSIKKENHGKLVEIPSGAGHDGVMISKVAPIAMLFVRCKEGISHNPLEHVEPADIKAALNVCHHFMDELISITKNK